MPKCGLVCTAAPAPLSASSVAEGYLRWASEAGVVSPKVAQAFFGDLRGAKALQDIAADELFISVPRSAALVVEPRSRCPCPDFVAPSHWKEAPWYVKMAILLLVEEGRGRSSPVWGYISQLPQSIDVPVRWEDAEIAELQYPPVQAEVLQQRTAWRQQYDRFQAAARELGGAKVSWDRWLWALENVRSRAFSGPFAGAPLPERLRLAGAVATAGIAYIAWAHVPLEQALNGAIAAALFNLMYDVLLSSKLKWYALVPVVDSINHCSQVESKIEFEYFQGAFVTSVNKRCAAGEQVYISYGPQTNDSLLQFYGFTELSNPNDTYVLRTSLPGSSSEMRLVVNANGSFTAESSKAARAAAAAGGDSDKQLPAAVEAALQGSLLAALEAELSSKPTSLADDERLLKSAHMMAPRARAATEFRAEKKRVLQRAIQRTQKRIAKLMQRDS